MINSTRHIGYYNHFALIIKGHLMSWLPERSCRGGFQTRPAHVAKMQCSAFALLSPQQ